MQVQQIMTKDPAFCLADTRLADVARLMTERDCGQIPVVDSETSMKPIGVVTDRDIVVRAMALGRDPMGMTARDVMSSPAVTVHPEAKIEECCQLLQDAQVRRVPVVDERGSCCGMVSQADIAQHVPEKMTGQVVRAVSKSGSDTSV